MFFRHTHCFRFDPRPRPPSHPLHPRLIQILYVQNNGDILTARMQEQADSCITGVTGMRQQNEPATNHLLFFRTGEKHKRALNQVNPYNAGIDFSPQNLTTKVDPRTVKVKNIHNGRRPNT